jgi:hypothetical protein
MMYTILLPNLTFLARALKRTTMLALAAIRLDHACSTHAACCRLAAVTTAARRLLPRRTRSNS